MQPRFPPWRNSLVYDLRFLHFDKVPPDYRWNRTATYSSSLVGPDTSVRLNYHSWIFAPPSRIKLMRR